jgi:hypothetical protein
MRLGRITRFYYVAARREGSAADGLLGVGLHFVFANGLSGSLRSGLNDLTAGAVGHIPQPGKHAAQCRSTAVPLR